MKTIISALSISLLVATSAAFGYPASPVQGAAAKPAQAQAMSDMVDGEVRKIDKDARKITLRHSEIKKLEMPAMTMVFQVKDPAMLDKVKAGDKVKFKAESAGGTLTVTEIEPAK